MKRVDAFRKVRTVCQRLDRVDLTTFPVQPLKLYLFGSLLTNKPDPHDADLILVFDKGRSIDIDRDIVTALSYGLPLPFEQARTQLRRGMKMINIEDAEGGLQNWLQLNLLLAGIRPRLIWKPGFDWGAALDRIEQSPEVWGGPRPPGAKEQLEAWIRTLPEAEKEAKLAQAIAEIEAQG
jgi:hypothetical protein